MVLKYLKTNLWQFMYEQTIYWETVSKDTIGNILTAKFAYMKIVVDLEFQNLDTP